MKKQWVVGSRGSALALRQTEWVLDQLKSFHPQSEFKIEVIKTTGDKMLKTPFTQMVGKGFFTKEIEEALLAKEIDFAVHSLKDLPSETPPGLTFETFPQREDPRDVLISQSGKKLEELPAGATVGTSSPRRQAWILALRPDLKIFPLRGNLSTRLDKVLKNELVGSEGKVDAAVLALAGLKRLGLDNLVTEILEPEKFLPAPGQGLLAVEARTEDTETLDLLASIHSQESSWVASAERGFLAAWGGGCSVPLGALAQIRDSELELEAAVYLEEEKRSVRDKIKGKKEDGAELGKQLAERLRKQ